MVLASGVGDGVAVGAGVGVGTLGRFAPSDTVSTVWRRISTSSMCRKSTDGETTAKLPSEPALKLIWVMVPMGSPLG